MATIFEALTIAAGHHQSGRLQAAEQIVRQILQVDPNQADAFQLLGMIASSAGKHELAVQHFQRSIGLKENVAEFHNRLGATLFVLRKIPEAIACYRRVLELKPDYAQVHSNLGDAFLEHGRPDEAIPCFRRSLTLKPDYASAHLGLGNALRETGKSDEAIACFRRAITFQPELVVAHMNLGIALKNQGDLNEAVACYRRALQLKSDFAEAHNNLGIALNLKGSQNEAADSFRRAIALKPNYAAAYNNLGIALKELGLLDESVRSLRRALELKPDYAAACLNLGSTLKDQGKLDEAVTSFRHALERKPDFADAYSNLLYALVFHHGYDAPMLYEEHRAYERSFAAPLTKFIEPHCIDKTPDRRLRIGYVSSNFCDHVVGRNLVPLFREHDHSRFEVFAYADVRRDDEFTARFRKYSDSWRNTEGQSDEVLAQRIREDRIDILVDLTLHMARNRLLVFARKPAPVQATFAGYPGTTGLSAIDYRLTDPYLDPPDLFDCHYSEKSIRLPKSFWCYDPDERTPEVVDPPAETNGHITFGCLNNFCKVNAPVLEIWAAVLCAVDRSQLLVLTDTGSHRNEALEQLARAGVTPDRVTFLSKRPRADYLEICQRIDIALDTVPYNAHTTSLDCLWMGVPVVTLVGSTVVGRAGLSQLTNLGLPDLIAHDAAQYVRIAAKLAGDLSRLKKLRTTLRERMRASPLMDAPGFARSIEAAYREMWRLWCANPSRTAKEINDADLPH